MNRFLESKGFMHWLERKYHIKTSLLGREFFAFFVRKGKFLSQGGYYSTIHIEGLDFLSSGYLNF